MLRIHVYAAAAIAVASIQLPAGGSDAGRPVKVGELAPAFSAKSVAGKSIRLSSLRGKVVVLDFWTTT